MYWDIGAVVAFFTILSIVLGWVLAILCFGVFCLGLAIFNSVKNGLLWVTSKVRLG